MIKLKHFSTVILFCGFIKSSQEFPSLKSLAALTLVKEKLPLPKDHTEAEDDVLQQIRDVQNKFQETNKITQKLILDLKEFIDDNPIELNEARQKITGKLLRTCKKYLLKISSVLNAANQGFYTKPELVTHKRKKRSTQNIEDLIEIIEKKLYSTRSPSIYQIITTLLTKKNELPIDELLDLNKCIKQLQEITVGLDLLQHYTEDQFYEIKKSIQDLPIIT